MTAPMFDGIPAALSSVDAWVLWKLESRNGKTTKVPYDAHKGRAASPVNPDTWNALDMAQARYTYSRGNGTRFDGVGFVLHPSQRLVGFDLDGVIDPTTGVIAAWAQRLVNELDSYTEVTPSGRGLHVFVRGEIPAGRRRPGLEVYARDRFFTVTGAHLVGTPTDVHERQAVIDAVMSREFSGGGGHVADFAYVPDLDPLTDVDRALVADVLARDPAFSALWAGDLGAYGGDHSRADLALVDRLLRLVDDPVRVDRLFRSSALMRPKWDRADYAARTLRRAAGDVEGISPTLVEGIASRGTLDQTKPQRATREGDEHGAGGGSPREGEKAAWARDDTPDTKAAISISGGSEAMRDESRIVDAGRGELRSLRAIVTPRAVDVDNMAAISTALGRIIGGEHARDMLALTMAAVVDARLQEMTEPDWLGLIAPPSSGKTESLIAVKGPITAFLDTPASAASFSSAARGPKGEKAVSLLEEINGKCVVIKDTAALLAADPAKSKAILGTLTNCFDGSFDKATGLAFEGDTAIMRVESRFSLVFASTVEKWLENSQATSETGARALIYLAQTTAAAEADWVRARDPRKREYRQTLARLVQTRIERTIQTRQPVTIPSDVDAWLRLGAQLIALGRTPTRSERIFDDDTQNSRYIESPGTTEGPFRSYAQLVSKLTNLCRLHEHAEPTEIELTVLRRVILSSATLARAQVLVPCAGRVFTLADAVTATGITRDALAYRLDGMERLGILEATRQGTGVATEYRLHPRFTPLLQTPGSAPRTSQ